MTTEVLLNLVSSSFPPSDIPVKIEIIDTSLRIVKEDWYLTKGQPIISLNPGVYAVRATVSSGAIFEQVIQVSEGEQESYSIPLYEISPHETHEWAYLTQLIDTPSKVLLTSPLYEGLWMRLWNRGGDGFWKVMPFPGGGSIPGQGPFTVYPDNDGTSYILNGLGHGLFALQFGGPKIPWKIVALPSSYEVRVLVRPGTAPPGRAHPLDVVVAGDDWNTESLLSLMQSGDMSTANSLVEKKVELAEGLLYGKVRDRNAAAVGGYFLLRVGSVKRLHNWAEHLADWFPDMADGPIIHAWQLIRAARQEGSDAQDLFNQARQRLTEAVRRGFPLYTEGLRLLRDGLILMNQRARGEDKQVRIALEQFSRYTACVDWSVSNTTFTGPTPDLPSEDLHYGIPGGNDRLLYVFDVPLEAAIDRHVLHPGDELLNQYSNLSWHARVSAEGTLELEDGRSFASLGALEMALTGKSSGEWQNWQVRSTDNSLFWVMRSLREPSSPA